MRHCLLVWAIYPTKPIMLTSQLFPYNMGRRVPFTFGYIVLFLLGLVAVGQVLSPAAAAPLEVNRTVESTELEPGQSTTVTVTVVTDNRTDLNHREHFDPAFAEISVLRISNGFSAETPSTLLVVWDDAETFTATYRVTIPEEATPGDRFRISNNSVVDTIRVTEPDTPDGSSTSPVTAPVLVAAVAILAVVVGSYLRRN